MKIMFVCSGNFTRSVIAELCLRHYLKDRGMQGVVCASSGTHSNGDVTRLLKEHFVRMTELGIDVSEFKRRQFNADFLSAYDVVVAMAIEQQDYIQNEYKKRVPLFNEVCKGEETSVVIQGVDEEEIKAELRELVDTIHRAIPGFVAALTKCGE